MPPFSRPTTTPPSARTGAANVGILGAILLAVLILSVRCGNRAVKTLVRSADEGIQQMDGLHRTPTNGRAAGNDAVDASSSRRPDRTFGHLGPHTTLNAARSFLNRESDTASPRTEPTTYDEPMLGSSLTVFDASGSCTYPDSR